MLFAVALIAPRAFGVLAYLRRGGVVRVGVVSAAVDLCADCVGPLMANSTQGDVCSSPPPARTGRIPSLTAMRFDGSLPQST